MEKKIFDSLIKRPGMTEKDDLLKDMIGDSIAEIRAILNYEDDEDLPEGCIPAIKELTMIKVNRDGAEGIQSESQSSGGSTTYTDELSNSIKRAIRHYRRLPR